MTVKLQIVGVDVEAVADNGAGSAVVGKSLACKLVIWKNMRKVKVGQGDASILREDFIANISYKVMDSSSVLGKFVIVMAKMYIGWEPLAAAIGTNSYGGWVALYLASYIYICLSCTQLSVQIPSKILSHWEIS